MKTPTFDPQRSAEIRAQLQHLANSEAPIASSPRPKPWARPVFALASVATVGLLVAGSLQSSAASAQAESTLQDLAQASITYQDPQPGPGQYLKIDKSGPARACTLDDQGEPSCYANGFSTRNYFIPADPNAEWVFEMRESAHPEYDEIDHAHDGAFFGSPMYWVDDLLPHASSGQELYDHVDQSYDGGSLSRNENNFVRLTDALKEGVLSAADRAVFYEALTRVPGVDVTLGVTTSDGREGISIGRTEPLRMGLREEIIVDQHTGQVIGQREISTLEILGYGLKGEVVNEGSIVYSIVDQVPAEKLLPQRSGPFIEGVDGRDG